MTEQENTLKKFIICHEAKKVYTANSEEEAETMFIKEGFKDEDVLFIKEVVWNAEAIDYSKGVDLMPDGTTKGRVIGCWVEK
jgi:hypothetical protein